MTHIKINGKYASVIYCLEWWGRVFCGAAIIGSFYGIYQADRFQMKALLFVGLIMAISAYSYRVRTDLDSINKIIKHDMIFMGIHFKNEMPFSEVKIKAIQHRSGGPASYPVLWFIKGNGKKYKIGELSDGNLDEAVWAITDFYNFPYDRDSK